MLFRSFAAFKVDKWTDDDRKLLKLFQSALTLGRNDDAKIAAKELGQRCITLHPYNVIAS
jgi:hypothetical protein